MQELQQEKAELTISAGEGHIFPHPTQTNVLAYISLVCCVCVRVVNIINPYTIWLHRHHQCSIPFFSSSAHYLQRDSREVIHGPPDAITWPVAEQLSYTVTHPMCNNGSWKTAKLSFVILVNYTACLYVSLATYTFLSLKVSAIWDPAIFTFFIFKLVLM